MGKEQTMSGTTIGYKLQALGQLPNPHLNSVASSLFADPYQS